MRAFSRLTLVIGLIVSGTAIAAQTPKLIYPPSDPAKDIAFALDAAKYDHKRVLIDFGADWCPDCRVLGALLDDGAVAPFLQSHFHVVHVDVGRRDKNADIVARYGATSDAWIPAVVVLDENGKTAAATDDKVRITRRNTPQEILSLLQQWTPTPPSLALAAFTESGVRVSIALEHDSRGQPWLAGTFTPADAASHLYSTDLPVDGMQGLGRPTRLSIVSTSGLRARGPIVANQPIESDRIDALNLTLPIYPAGPVTLRMPVDLPSASAIANTELSITYMNCGSKGCLRPVIDKRVVVVIPRRSSN